MRDKGSANPAERDQQRDYNGNNRFPGNESRGERHHVLFVGLWVKPRPNPFQNAPEEHDNHDGCRHEHPNSDSGGRRHPFDFSVFKHGQENADHGADEEGVNGAGRQCAHASREYFGEAGPLSRNGRG